MFRTLAAAFALSAALPGFGLAETYDVEMLNRGEGRETMVFSPDALRLAPGDTVRFLASDRGHSAESIPEMWPDGVAPFVGAINEEVEITFDQEGFYAIKCKPHFAMGMVMTIVVGDATEAPDGWLEGRLPRKTKERLEAQLAELTQ